MMRRRQALARFTAAGLAWAGVGAFARNPRESNPEEGEDAGATHPVGTRSLGGAALPPDSRASGDLATFLDDGARVFRIETGTDSTPKVWDAATGHRAATHPRIWSESDTLAVSPDGKLLACNGPDRSCIKMPRGFPIVSYHPIVEGGRVHVWEVATGKLVLGLATRVEAVHNPAFKDVAAPRSWWCDKMLHRGPTLWLWFTRDSHWIVAFDIDQIVTAWNARSGEEMFTIDDMIAISPDGPNEQSISRSDDGRRFVVHRYENLPEGRLIARKPVLTLWDLDTLSARKLILDTDLRGNSILSRDGQRFARRTDPKTLTLFDFDTAQEIRQYNIASEEKGLWSHYTYGFSPDGRSLIGLRSGKAKDAPALAVWDIVGQELRLRQTVDGPPGEIRDMAYLPDRIVRVLSAGPPQEVHAPIPDLPEGELKPERKPSEGRLLGVSHPLLVWDVPLKPPLKN